MTTDSTLPFSAYSSRFQLLLFAMETFFVVVSTISLYFLQRTSAIDFSVVLSLLTYYIWASESVTAWLMFLLVALVSASFKWWDISVIMDSWIKLFGKNALVRQGTNILELDAKAWQLFRVLRAALNLSTVIELFSPLFAALISLRSAFPVTLLPASLLDIVDTRNMYSLAMTNSICVNHLLLIQRVCFGHSHFHRRARKQAFIKIIAFSSPH